MKLKKIASLVAFIAFLAVVSWGCGKSKSTSTTTGGGTTTPPNTVNINGMTFTPSTLTVKVGTKVTWKNNDGVTHTVTSDDGTSFDSGSLNSGGTFSFTPAAAGTYGYHCTIHAGMTATLVVTE